MDSIASFRRAERERDPVGHGQDPGPARLALAHRMRANVLLPQIQGGDAMTIIRKLTLAAAFAGCSPHCRPAAHAQSASLAAAPGEVHPAVRRRQRDRHRGAADRRAGSPPNGASRSSSRTGRARDGLVAHQRLHLGGRRPRAALRLERELHRASRTRRRRCPTTSSATSRRSRASATPCCRPRVPAVDAATRRSREFVARGEEGRRTSTTVAGAAGPAGVRAPWRS